MKRSTAILSSAIATILFSVQVKAATYYWDTNSTTSGLGNTAGIWGTSTFLGTVPSGALDGTASTAGTATTNADAIYFGTNNLSLGSMAATIGIVGSGVTINTIVFGTGLGSQGVTLSGGGGTITLAGTSPAAIPTITTNNTGSNTIGAVLDGTVGLVKAGNGTLVLTANNPFSGGLTITGGGTLQAGNGSTGTLVSQALTFDLGGGVFNVQEAPDSAPPVVGDTPTGQSMGILKFGGGEGTVKLTYAGSGTSTLTLDALDLAINGRTAGATGNFVVSGGTNGTNTFIRIAIASGQNMLLDKAYFFGGNAYAAYDLEGYMRAYGAGDADFVSVGAGADMGTVAITDNVSLTGSLTQQGDAAVNTINLGAYSIAMDSSGTSLVLQTDGLLSSGASSATIGGGTTPRLQSVTPGEELVIRVDGSSDQLTISSIIQDNTSASGLTKSGAGTLVLSGANTYTGTTTINAGTLALSGGAAIANTVPVTLASAPGVVLRLDSSETIGSLSGGGISGGTVNVQGNTLILAGTSTFGGTLTGTSSGGVTVSSGTLTLSNKNTFAGTISLQGGSQLTLTYGNDGTASASTVSSGGTINLANGSSILLSPATQVTAGVAAGGQNVPTGGSIVSNAIVVSSGTGTLKFGKSGGGGDAKFVFSGGVTGGTSGSQTLSIVQGATGGNGERTDILFSGLIQNGAGGTLGVNADFLAASSTSQNSYINLSGQNTFTGPIVVNNTKNLTYSFNGNSSTGGYFAVGGEISHISFGARTATAGTGYIGGGNYTNTISLAAGTIFDYISSSNQILGGVISGAGNLLKEAGTGTLTLTAANTFTGNTTVSAGTLTLANALALQNSALVTTSGTSTLSGVSGALTIGGLSGASGNLGSATVLNGYTANINALTLNPQTNVSVTYGGVIANGSGATTLTKTGAGTQTLSGANTYTGATTINAGTLAFSSINLVASANPLGQSTNVATNLILNGGILLSSGTGGTTDRLFSLQSSSTIDSSGSAALVFNNTGSMGFNGSTAAKTLTLQGSNTGANTLAAIIANNTGATSLTKTGSGTWVLSGTNTYTGATTINGGILALGNGGNLNGASAVAVNSGGTLGIRQNASSTSNAIAGTVTLAAGSSLNMGDGFASTLNVTGATTLAPASGSSPVLTFDIVGSAADKLAITGAVTVGAGAAKITIAPSTTAITAGTYTVISAASGLNTANLSLLSTILPNSAGLYTLSANVSSATATTVTVAADSNALYWKGGTSTNWSTATNWTTNQTGTTTSASAPSTTSNVAFSASGAGNLTTNTLGSALTVNSVNFLPGSATVTIATSANQLTINGGGITNGSANAMNIANPVTLGAAQTWNNNGTGLLTISGNVTNGSNTLTIAGSGDTTISGIIGSGTGGLTMSGTGTLTLSGNNTYSGTTTINSGTVKLGSTTALGSATAGTTIASGGTLDLNGRSIAETFGAIVGAGVGGLGALINSSATAATLSGTVNIASSVCTIGGTGNVSLSDLVTSAGSSITKTGTNTVTLGGTTDDVGLAVIVNSGTLVLGKSSSATVRAIGADSTVNSGATLQLGGSSNFQIAGGVNVTVASGGVFDLNGRSQTYTGQSATNGSININGSGINGGGALINNSGTSTVTFGSGGLVMQSNSSVGGSGNITIAGAISGAFALTKVGSGTLNLSGTNTYSGATNINGGTLQVSGTGSLGSGNYAGAISTASGTLLQYSSSTNQTLSGAISGAGGITKDTSTSDLTLSNSANTYTGPTTVSAGRLIISTNSGALSPSTAVTVSGNATVGGQLYIQTASASFANNFTISGVGSLSSGSPSVNGGALRLTGNTLSGTITLADDARIGTIGSTAANTFSGQITGAYGVDFFSGATSNSSTYTHILANTGTANNYTGNTSISVADYNGTFTNVSAVLRLGASEQIPDGTDRGNLVFNGADANHVSIFELNGFNETVNGLSNVAAAGAKIQNTSTGSSILTVGTGNTTSSFSGTLTDGGVGKTLGITKTGTGTLTLSGTNTYIGTTTVNSGTLKVSGSISGSLAVNVNSGALVLAANNAVNNTSANLTLGNNAGSTSGSLTLENTASNRTQRFGTFSLSYNSTLDFGNGTGVQDLTFNGLGTLQSGMSLAITNWSGSSATAGVVGVNDRLLFQNISDLSAFNASLSSISISFNGLAGYQAISLGGNTYEIVAIPEPSTWTAIGLTLGLLGYRNWRRRRSAA